MIVPIIVLLLLALTFHVSYGEISLTPQALVTRTGWKRMTIRREDIRAARIVPSYRVGSNFVLVQDVQQGAWLKAELRPSTVINLLVPGRAVCVELDNGRRLVIATKHSDKLIIALESKTA